MKNRALLLPFALACIAASAGEPKTYTPEIHGLLTSGKQPVASNVCLRQSDSEIRNCGYADASGRFLIGSGPVRRSPLIDEKEAKKPLHFWLETGNVLSPQKLWPIEVSADRNAAIELDCDMAQPGRGDPTFRSCVVRPTKPLVVREQRDDTPYRMPRPANTTK
ncbi:MAG TPA: hypothetical protein VFL30_08430 [Rhodanobacteraceae bacterium]|nr:hypothetical protein [Rhodanobacteraceae bacterium]